MLFRSLCVLRSGSWQVVFSRWAPADLLDCRLFRFLQSAAQFQFHPLCFFSCLSLSLSLSLTISLSLSEPPLSLVTHSRLPSSSVGQMLTPEMRRCCETLLCVSNKICRPYVFMALLQVHMYEGAFYHAHGRMHVIWSLKGLQKA